MLLKKTKLEKTEKNHKITKTQIPPGGWGVGLKEPTQTCFLLLGYNALVEMLFGLCYLGSKGLQNTKKRNAVEGRASWKLWMSKKCVFGQSFLLFFNGPAKNQQANVSKSVQIHFLQHKKIPTKI